MFRRGLADMVFALENLSRSCIAQLCRLIGIGERSLRRWSKQRPSKLVPVSGFDMPLFNVYDEELQRKAATLEHGAKRSKGSGELHEKMKDKLSRRQIDQGIAALTTARLS